MRTGELIHDSPKNRIEIGLLPFRRHAAQPYTAGCPRDRSAESMTLRKTACAQLLFRCVGLHGRRSGRG
jgi:hypothetical protein